MTAVVVLHAPGDERAGQPWRDALAGAGWAGDVIAPDLPGHGSSPAPQGGSYEVGDALLPVIPLLDGLDPAIVVGCGANGWCAQILGLAGRASAVVLVDGLNGPWRSPLEQIHEGRDWLRAIADDPAALAPPPPDGLDPRLRHGIGTMGNRDYAFRVAGALPVPTLIVESGGSSLTDREVDELADAHAAGATVVRLDHGECSADRVVAEIAAWATGLGAATMAYAGDPEV